MAYFQEGSVHTFREVNGIHSGGEWHTFGR